MRRKLFTLAAALSAVVSVFCIVADLAPEKIDFMLPLNGVARGEWAVAIFDRRVGLYAFRGPRHYTCYMPPIGPFALVAALPPGLWIRRRYKDRTTSRRSGEYCSKCGYDLRGTPDRCPEWGRRRRQRGRRQDEYHGS